jgi:hypothetical protein
MPIGIMKVLNEGWNPVSYINKESGYSFSLPGNVEAERQIPCSPTKDDTMPWYNAESNQKHIEIRVGNAVFKISERSAKFYVEWEGANGSESLSFGTMSNGGQYMISIMGGKNENGTLRFIVMIYNYLSSFKDMDTYIPDKAFRSTNPGSVGDATLEVRNR